MLGLKLNHVSKRDHRAHDIQYPAWIVNGWIVNFALRGKMSITRDIPMLGVTKNADMCLCFLNINSTRQRLKLWHCSPMNATEDFWWQVNIVEVKPLPVPILIYNDICWVKIYVTMSTKMPIPQNLLVQCTQVHSCRISVCYVTLLLRSETDETWSLIVCLVHTTGQVMNSLWNNDMWRHVSGTTLVKLTTSCLTAPSHYH